MTRGTGAQPGPAGPWSGGWLQRARIVRSPNCDPRPPAVIIDSLIIHYISLPPGRFGGDAIERLFTNRLDPQADPAFVPLTGLRVSSHFLIRRTGELVQFVDCGQRAWHAGVSRLLDRERCNDFSIGVELEGDGEHRFTHAQYRRLTALARLLCRRYPLAWVAGHSDIAPDRKQDPGPFFDWDRWMGSIESTPLSRPIPVASRSLPKGCP